MLVKRTLAGREDGAAFYLKNMAEIYKRDIIYYIFYIKEIFLKYYITFSTNSTRDN